MDTKQDTDRPLVPVIFRVAVCHLIYGVLCWINEVNTLGEAGQ